MYKNLTPKIVGATRGESDICFICKRAYVSLGRLGILEFTSYAADADEFTVTGLAGYLPTLYSNMSCANQLIGAINIVFEDVVASGVPCNLWPMTRRLGYFSDRNW